MVIVEPITPKEEAFCRALVLDGLGPAAAYRASRDASRMANSSVHANAKKILRRPRVKARIEELRREKARWESPIQIQSPTRTRACARVRPMTKRFCPTGRNVSAKIEAPLREGGFETDTRTRARVRA
jgi:hypothetical protein